MEITNQEKLTQLDRILRSRIFQGSESLKSFLQYITQKTIEEQSSSLKEYVIATEVFGRRDDYDPRTDSVVRVQASRLRAKLQDYYTTEGQRDQVLIELPKGHYIPYFSRLESQPPNPANPVAEIRQSNSETPVLKSATDEAVEAERQAVAPLWGDLLRSPEPCLVVFSNTLFEGSAETGMRLYKPLDAPGSHTGSFASFLAFQEQQSIVEHYTGIGETMGVYFLSDFFARVRHPFRLKRSLLVNWEDLKTENIVVLGSPAENFFLRELPQKQELVFQKVRDEHEHDTFGIVNLSPREGEQQVYLARQEGPSRSQISRDYALISVLQGLGAKKRILILAGITTYATQAAAEYVTLPEYIEDLITHLNIAPPSEPPQLPHSYQILVEVKVNDGVPINVSYVMHHVL